MTGAAMPVGSTHRATARHWVDLDHSRFLVGRYHRIAMGTYFRRRRRQWIAGLLTFLVAFAGVIAAAHGCALQQLALQPVTAGAAFDSALMPDCADMARHDAQANACESHCVGGQQANAHAEAPTASLALQPALRIQVAMHRLLPASASREPPAAVSAAPPPHLRFTRLLI